MFYGPQKTVARRTEPGAKAPGLCISAGIASDPAGSEGDRPQSARPPFSDVLRERCGKFSSGSYRRKRSEKPFRRGRHLASWLENRETWLEVPFNAAGSLASPA